MSDAITASIERQSGLVRELNIIANNIANASSVGYKREAAIFAEYVQAKGREPSLSLGSLRGHYADLDPGTMTRTGGALDLAVEGEGWFAVTRGGEVLLTRAGNFARDGEGRLVTGDGDPVLDEGGSPIELPEGAADISVGSDGTVTANGFALAKIGVLTAAPEDLSRVGDSLWRSEGPTRFIEDAHIRQGFLEGSNVSAVGEMARLIHTQRLYEAGAAMQTDEHERIQGLIEAIGRG